MKYQKETESLLTALVAAGFSLIACEHEYKTFYHPKHRDGFVKELMACDESVLSVSHPDHHKSLSLFLVYGNSPGELVSDYTVFGPLEAVLDAESKRWEASTVVSVPLLETRTVKPLTERQLQILEAALQYFENDINDGEKLEAGDGVVVTSDEIEGIRLCLTAVKP